MRKPCKSITAVLINFLPKLTKIRPNTRKWCGEWSGTLDHNRMAVNICMLRPKQPQRSYRPNEVEGNSPTKINAVVGKIDILIMIIKHSKDWVFFINWTDKLWWTVLPYWFRHDSLESVWTWTDESLRKGWIFRFILFCVRIARFGQIRRFLTKGWIFACL